VRTHVAIDPKTRTQIEGALFGTEALAFDPRLVGAAEAPVEAMLCALSGDLAGWQAARTFIPLGGEGRQAELAPAGDDVAWPRLPEALRERLTGSQRLRLQLVTPAIFANAWPESVDGPSPPPGWLPAWIDPATLSGKPPGWRGASWRLVSAVVGRRVAISGWDMTYRHPRTGRRGRPKRTRYAVPAGSVYFFALYAPLTADEADALWLRAVADRAYDRRNGFGLALPGIWEAWQRKEAS
jgi:CRISPR-associated protein Cmr3